MADQINQISQAIGQLQAGQSENRERAAAFELEMRTALRDMVNEVKALRHDVNNKLSLVYARIELVESKHKIAEGVAKRMALIWASAGTLGGTLLGAMLQLIWARWGLK